MRPLWLVALAACGDNHAVHPDAAVDSRMPVDAAQLADASPDADPLATLLGTGLCADAACTQINPGISSYTPQFALWADGATKRRWIYIPPGQQIDTSDMDYWVFPQGTKIWKEFSVGGVKIETRFIWKVGPGNTFTDWHYMPYQWNAAGDDTVAVPHGAKNANGTTHDIPSEQDCITCHENLQPTRVLGFGALQLDQHAAAGEIDLDAAIANGWLTAPPAGTTPRFALPSQTGKEPAALGYLHANCGHCHNPTSHVFTDNGVTMVLRETVGTLGSVATTQPYVTAVGQPTMTGLPMAIANNCTGAGGTMVPCIITHGDPDDSAMIVRFETTNPTYHMPALATKVTDPTGDTTLRDWITAIP